MQPDISPVQTGKTLVHELGYALLHGDGVARSLTLQDAKVESVAYVVCHALGSTAGKYTFAYIAGWANGSSELVKEAAQRAISCAKEILTGLLLGEATIPHPGEFLS